MNNTVKRAMEIDEWGQNLPDVEIGDVVTLREVWEGDGEIPTESYSYTLTDDDWIDYRFEVVQENKEDPMETMVRITEINLI